MSYFDSFSRPRSVLLDHSTNPLSIQTASDCLILLAGPMLCRRFGLLRMAWYHDPLKSVEFLCLKVERLAWASNSAVVLETRHYVCKAVTLNHSLNDRDVYMEQCIEMLGARLMEGVTLEVLEPGLKAMNAQWDLLDLFRKLESLPKHIQTG